jgi:hypothetical protein
MAADLLGQDRVIHQPHRANILSCQTIIFPQIDLFAKLHGNHISYAGG